MELKKYTKEDLEQLTYSEVAELILIDKNNKMKIVDVFKKLCELLQLSDKEFEDHIADFYELIATDGRFIVLDKGFCDLRKKHAPNITFEDEEETDEEETSEDDIDEEIEDESSTEDNDIFYDNSSDEDDVTDDDELDDFVLVEEDEEASM